jgi:hypothetical protein
MIIIRLFLKLSRVILFCQIGAAVELAGWVSGASRHDRRPAPAPRNPLSRHQLRMVGYAPVPRFVVAGNGADPPEKVEPRLPTVRRRATLARGAPFSDAIFFYIWRPSRVFYALVSIQVPSVGSRREP